MKVLALLLCSLCFLAFSPVLLAESRSLSFYHTHTGRTLEIVYYQNGSRNDDGIQAINQFLSDFRSGDVHPIAVDLLDLLHEIHTLTKSQKPFEVISAYRSEATNQMLRSRSVDSGVARKSMHLLGSAIDVRLADVPL